MFGDDDQKPAQDATATTDTSTLTSAAPLQQGTISAPAAEEPSVTPSAEPAEAPVGNDLPSLNTTPLDSIISDSSVPAPSPTPAEPAASTDTPLPDLSAPSSTTPDSSSSSPANEDLIRIKQEALQSLSPLLNHLDQTPEEKFRTTMMMIQASDDQTMVEAAYTAAKEITDEKAKAQALLDVVNEINYFTQQAAAATPEN